MSQPKLTVALAGNPNAGKTSLFNQLTGLNQRIGNFPGVTVEKKTGTTWLNNNTACNVTDLPGTYSLYPKSPDEQVVFDVLHNTADPLYPDIVVVVADAGNLKRNLLLFTQIADLQIPVILALNMVDLAEKAGCVFDLEVLKQRLQVPIVRINGRTGEGLTDLKQAILKFSFVPPNPWFRPEDAAPELVNKVRDRFNLDNSYRAFQLAHQYRSMSSLSAADKHFLDDITLRYEFRNLSFQAAETISRYEAINKALFDAMFITPPAGSSVTERLDKVLTHRIWGYLIFFGILTVLFQAIFSWASYPMDLIDTGIGALNTWLKGVLPAGPATDLLTDGVIAGLGGVLIFIPQIALLFAFIAVLEESGYMARVMFIMDRVMRKFGLNGRSVVPLISGVACAVPAIMATRSIDNTRDRLVTIFVTPLMSCSARIPVYTVLISLVVPQQFFFGIINLQGLAMMGLYLLGFLAAVGSAWLLKQMAVTKAKRSFFIMELPSYKMPRWGNVGYTIADKVKAFVFEAGKVIVAISVILWVLATYGPGDAMKAADDKAEALAKTQNLNDTQKENLIAAGRLEASYAGHFGKAIEPIIRPLGFDWKIGIALITSFAAREVFIGTMSTIYSIGSDQNEDTVRERMAAERDPLTGGPMYTPARSFSLLIFYVFAMQCMSTLAVTYRETKGWKYPLLQTFYMTGLAWVASLAVWQIFG
ncbi:MAG: ferrous iron transport protein B [Bacteroidota bacterium]